MSLPPPADAAVYPVVFRQHAPLAPRTTLGLGGSARWLLEAQADETLISGLAWAAEQGVPAVLLGGGSNVVVADRGVDALVVALGQRGLDFREAGGDEVLVTVRAGEPWDPLVAATVARGLVGLECLSGIPGTCGATPIQNVGAYGREVAELLEAVTVLDRETLEIERWGPEDCGFAYRSSRFRRHPDRWAVLAVTFSLRRGGEPEIRYPELARAVERASDGHELTAEAVRRTVLDLRRGKSMVIDPGLGDPDDPNRRSVGSFFVNPIVEDPVADRVVEICLEEDLVGAPEEVPRFPVAGSGGETGRSKLAAAWLIERAGFERGTRRGPVGISSRHTLALVHHGGGTTADLLALAREVRAGVEDRFGVRLRPEPVFLGFDEGEDPLGSV